MADVDTVDDAVSVFTKSILDLALKNGVDFAYVGPKHSRPEEIQKVMKVNVKAMNDLLKK